MGIAANHSFPQGDARHRWKTSFPRDKWQVGGVDLVIFLMIGICAVASWAGIAPRVGGVDVLALTAVLAGGIPLYREARNDLVARKMTREVSMTIAIVATLAIREFSAAAFLLVFVLVARIGEELTMDRGRKALGSPLQQIPERTLVRRNGELLELPAADVLPGEVVVIGPDAGIPVDGIVVQGHSTVDQSSITGESRPVGKAPGSAVFAGTTNYSGTLEIRAHQLGHNTVLGRIVDANQEAASRRPPLHRLAERCTGWLVYFALASGTGIFVATHDARSAVVALIMAGAYGITTTASLAYLGALGRAARVRALTKDGRDLEELGTIDTLILDQTASFTFREPYVTAITPCPGEDPSVVLRLAATAVRPLEDPVARAILQEAARQKIIPGDPQAVAYRPGEGVRATWNGGEILVGTTAFLQNVQNLASQMQTLPDPSGEVLIAYRGGLLGALAVSDVVSPNSKEAIARVQAMGIDTILLTEEGCETAEGKARQLGVREVAVGLPAQEKRKRELIRSGKRFAVVGNGAASGFWAEATVRIAVASPTDFAQVDSGVVLLSNDLTDCAELVYTARGLRSTVRFSMVGISLLAGLGAALGAMNLVTPLAAAVVRLIAEIALILNSVRLLPLPGRR